ncbi:MAG TPA: acyltransferase family protein, partial [Alphaproteobacteria bacterium]|nr:acyltransferase family protein [Alphaproteobacteria bacterium]
MSQFRYRPDIDGMRAIAVLSVLLYHGNVSGIPGGFMGVDIFFVISGFLITSLILKDIENNNFSMISFWERRARRILPPLFLVVGFAILTGVYLLLPQDLVQLGKEIGSQSLFSSNILFTKQGGYFNVAADLKPLLHTWSLAVEEQYYVFFPISLFIIYRFLGTRYFAFLSLGLLFSLILCLVFTTIQQRYAFFLLPFRAWELLAGAILATGFIRKPENKTLSLIVSAIGACMLGFALFFYDKSYNFPGIISLLPVCGTVFIIWANSQTQPTALFKILSLKPIVFIGLISYSLYLWHWPIFVYESYLENIYSEFHTYTAPIMFISSFLLAWATYHFVEQPVRRKTVFASRRSIFVFSFIGLVLMGSFGGLTIYKSGFPQRFSEDTLRLANADKNSNPKRDECDQPSIDRIHRSKVCQFNATSGKPSFALWGDSHADVMAPLFEKLAHKYDANGFVLTARGCKPILHMENPDKTFKYNCIRDNQAFFELIKRENIREIFLVGLFSDLLGTDTTNVEMGDWYARYKDTYKDVRLAAFANTLDLLIENNVKIHIQIPFPVADKDPHRVLALRKRFGIDTDYSIPRNEFDAILDEGMKVIIEHYQDKVDFINPSNILCDASKCMTEKDGEVLYYNAT